ncbi:MAG: hypothetical protein C5B49_02200 [Bdellovibrio sp.]|nr:MAG: hypothetical protein C5B49_02200 [Bdellovibrio sp.]
MRHREEGIELMKPKVVLVDDEPDVTELFSLVLQSPSYEIEIFNDPSVAVEEMMIRPPDVLFLDYCMPGMNGDEVALAVGPKISKALITGNLDIQTQAKFDRIFLKPVAMTELRAFILEKIRADI